MTMFTLPPRDPAPDAPIQKIAAFVQVTQELIDDGQAWRDWFDSAAEDVAESLAGRPRLGPPAPVPEPDRCETCGHVLDDWDDD